MDKPIRERQLIVKNQLEDLMTINAFLEELGTEWEIPDAMVMTLLLVIEEAFTNVVNYAFTDDLAHDIELKVVKQDDLIRLSLLDDGVPYDPTGKEDPDTGLSVQERQIGGLGIFLIKQMMDHVTYERRDGRNVLIMEKQL